MRGRQPPRGRARGVLIPPGIQDPMTQGLSRPHRWAARNRLPPEPPPFWTRHPRGCTASEVPSPPARNRAATPTREGGPSGGGDTVSASAGTVTAGKADPFDRRATRQGQHEGREGPGSLKGEPCLPNECIRPLPLRFPARAFMGGAPEKRPRAKRKERSGNAPPRFPGFKRRMRGQSLEPGAYSSPPSFLGFPARRRAFRARFSS